MATKNINVSPYYDDFDASKNYHKILFRPTFSVQARELTQLQTILQDQISKGTDAILENGNNLVPGEIIIRKDISYVQLSTSTTGFNTNITLANLPGKTIEDSNGYIKAKVIAVSDQTTTESLTLFVSYLDGNGATSAFSDTESLREVGTEYAVGTVGRIAGVSTAITGTGSVAQVGGGVYYINGHMVNVTAQALVLDKYTTTPSYRIGFTLSESFVDNSTDSTLNDNAQGTTNYLAPGAHRYKISLTLAKRILTDTVTANNQGFVEVCRVVSGVIQKHDNFVESIVTDIEYNDRDYNENGNYIVDDFDIQIREYSSTLTDRNGLAGRNTPDAGAETTTFEGDLEIGIGAGCAVINGKTVKTNDTTWLKVDKTRESTDVIKIPSSGMNADIGTYVTTDITGEHNKRLYNTHNMVAFHAQEAGFTYGMNDGHGVSLSSGEILWDPSENDRDEFMQFASTQTNSPYWNVVLGEIHTDQQEGYNTTQGILGSAAQYGETGSRYAHRRGTARIRDIRKNPGIPGELDIYLFDIEAIDGQTLDKVNCLALDESMGIGGTNAEITGFPRIICQLQTDGLTTHDTSKNVSVYEIPEKNITSIDGIEISEVRRTGRFTPSSNTLTVTTTGTEEFAIEREPSGGGTTGPVKQTSLDNVLVYGELWTTAAEAKQGLVTSDSLNISFTNSQTMTISAATGAVGAFRLTTKFNPAVDVYGSGHPQVGKNKDLSWGDIFRIYVKDDNGEHKEDGCIVQYIYDAEDYEDNGTQYNAGNPSDSFAAWKVLYPGKGITNITNGTTFATNKLHVEVISAKNPDTATLDHFVFGDGTPAANLTFRELTFDNSSTYDVVYSVKKPRIAGDSGRATKTLVFATEYFTGTGNGNSNVVDVDIHSVGDEYTLGAVDVHPKVGTWKVEMADDFNDGTQSTSFPTDITSRYDIDTGQRDEYYGRAKLILKSGQQKPTGNLKVTYWKFTPGSGDYYSLESYPALDTAFTDANNVQWNAGANFVIGDIPSFVSSSGRTYNLGDCIDFRSSKDPTLAYNADTAFKSGNKIELPANNATITITDGTGNDNVQFYGGRIDKITLDENGNFSVTKGSAYQNEVTAPEDLEGELSLYTLRMLPYTYTTDDVYVEKVDNKRYDINDLKTIDKRVEQLELYNTLSPLEVEAKDYNHGDDWVRGFWVDSFLGHDKGDPTNSDYSCAIDANKKELRASFYQEGVAHSMDTTLTENNNSTLFNINETTNGSLITLKKDSTAGDVGEFINLETDTTDKLRSHPPGTYYGYMHLSPFFDNWKSTDSRPDVVFDKKKYFNSIKSMDNAELTQGTIWSDWKHHWTGTRINDSKIDIVTDTGLESDRMSEFETDKGFSIVSEKRGTREIAKNYYPYCRSKTITITVDGLKPSTDTVQIYFDGVEVTTSVTVTATYGTTGTTYKTDSSGKFIGTYTIPNVDEGVGTTKFRVGEKIVKVTANESEAQAIYNVSGYVDDVGMTNIAEYTQLEQLNEIFGQELIVDDDCFITKIDLYFSAKDTTLPVVVQLREMNEGKPTSRVLPYSTKILDPTINSETATTDNPEMSLTAATTITYSNYIYLKSGRYCLSLHSTSDVTAVHTLNSDAAVGSKPINLGGMYRGTKKISNKILKFQAYRAEFMSSAGDNVTFNVGVNADKKLDTSPVYTNSGDATSRKYMRIYQDAHGFKVNDSVTFNGFVGTTIQILNFGNGSGVGGTFTGTFTVGSLISTSSANPSAWTGDEKQGYVVKFDTTDASNQKLHVAVAQGTEFAASVAVYQFIASGTSTAYGTPGSLETPTAGVNGIPITDLNYSENTNNTFTVRATDYDSFVVDRDNTDVRALFTRFSPTESVAVVRAARRRADLIHHSVEQIVPKGTSISWEYSTDNSTYNPVEINETDRLVATEYLSGNIYLKATYTTTNTRVSPVVDVNTLQSILITNRLNNKKVNTGSSVEAGNFDSDKVVLFADPDSGSSIAGANVEVVQDSTQEYSYRTRAKFSRNGTAGWTATEKEKLSNIRVGDWIHVDIGAAGGSSHSIAFLYVYAVTDSGSDSMIIYGETSSDTNYLPTGFTHSSTTAPNAGDGVGITHYSGFTDERQPDDTSSVSKYIGKKVNLRFPATKLKIVADVNIPIDTDVEVWAKMSLSGGGSKDFDKLEYTKVPLYGMGVYGTYNTLTPVSNDNKFHESTYILPSVPSFNTVQIKIVFRGTESINSPRIKNMKSFALIE